LQIHHLRRICARISVYSHIAMKGSVMDYVKPSEVAETFVATGTAKVQLKIRDLLLRGFLSGSLLGFATTVAFSANAQGLPSVVGAVLFPAGFAMIVVLGLELVTGSFALLPTAWVAKQVALRKVAANLFWVFLGNLVGGCVYAGLYAAVMTQFHHIPAAGAGALIVAAAQAKTLGYEKLGATGIWLAIIKAALCNWMVCMGVVMGMTSRSTLGKIAGCWLPIFIFFALGFEHSVVNMFVIPAGIWMGAPVSLSDWWLWNQLPVTFGNLIGGFLFVGLPVLSIRAKTQPQRAAVSHAVSFADAEPEAAEA
jgi:formate/nitrite transporter